MNSIAHRKGRAARPTSNRSTKATGHLVTLELQIDLAELLRLRVDGKMLEDWIADCLRHRRHAMELAQRNIHINYPIECGTAKGGAK